MPAVKELLRAEEDGSLSFGDHTLGSKSKLDNYEFRGDLYKVKTFNEITKLERNGMFVYESVPGTAVTGFVASSSGVQFKVEGCCDAQITIGLEDSTEYDVSIDNVPAGVMKTNMGGKLTIGVELSPGSAVCVAVTKR